MKIDVVDPPTAEMTGLAWLLSKLEPVSEYGRLKVHDLRAFAFGEETQALEQIRRIARLAAAISVEEADGLRSSLERVADATAAIASLSLSDALTDTEFFDIVAFCDAVKRVLAQTTQPDFPRLPSLEAASRVLAVGRATTTGFYLDDAFDAALLRERTRLEKAQTAFDVARGRVAQRVAAAIGREEVPSGEFIVMREAVGQMLPPEIHAVREAPTYYLCELKLDDVALAALAERDASAQALAVREQAVRAKICADLRPHAPALQRATEILGDIDLLVAKVRFAQRYPGCVPLFADGPLVEFEQARFLPLVDELAREQGAYVPISLRVRNVAVLSGPNMGGKSVALRTCAFLVLCASLGVPVPAASATLTLFREVCWLGIGIDERSAGLLSAFAREVVRLRELLERKEEPSLILIDEFARTTNPREGRALLLALIAALGRRNVCALIATHLAGIAESAGVRHFAVRGLRELSASARPRCLTDALALLSASMDYTISEVTEDSVAAADAISLAEILGLDHELIAEARKAL